ncbi:MAG: DUF2807 domain-containing protein [Bacteroidetes bacterium]|nr:DUF2807 domain-containing protein [Bacteroidota bacterium]
MRLFTITLAFTLLVTAAAQTAASAQSPQSSQAGAATATPQPVDHFTKVIVSPYIQVTFVEGNTESVTINSLIVDSSKLHVEVNNKTLRLYLDGAKDIPHNQKEYNENGHSNSYPLYPNHAVIATVTYQKLESLSLRGEETQLCESPLDVRKFNLYIYGASRVIFTEMHARSMHAAIYGESTLEIRSGNIEEQRYTCYGEGKIHATAITGRSSKLKAFGEAEFNMNVSDRIKLTAFGEAKLRYMGNPSIVKGIHIGELHVEKID